MHHDLFGEIAYNTDDRCWTGSCPLPVFAEYGKLAPDDYRLSEPAPEFVLGVFALTVQDALGDGPTVEQANAFRFLKEHRMEDENGKRWVTVAWTISIVDSSRFFSAGLGKKCSRNCRSGLIR